MDESEIDEEDVDVDSLSPLPQSTSNIQQLHASTSHSTFLNILTKPERLRLSSKKVNAMR